MNLMFCDESLEAIEPIAAGDLKPDARIAAHLASCANCRAVLDRARQIGLDAGLHYVYEGNIYSDAANTSCPNCGGLLVRRSWHDVLENHIKDGACPKCGTAIPGVWTNDAKGNGWLKHAASSRTKAYTHLNL